MAMPGGFGSAAAYTAWKMNEKTRKAATIAAFRVLYIVSASDHRAISRGKDHAALAGLVEGMTVASMRVSACKCCR